MDVCFVDMMTYTTQDEAVGGTRSKMQFKKFICIGKLSRVDHVNHSKKCCGLNAIGNARWTNTLHDCRVS